MGSCLSPGSPKPPTSPIRPPSRHQCPSASGISTVPASRLPKPVPSSHDLSGMSVSCPSPVASPPAVSQGLRIKARIPALMYKETPIPPLLSPRAPRHSPPWAAPAHLFFLGLNMASQFPTQGFSLVRFPACNNLLFFLLPFSFLLSILLLYSTGPGRSALSSNRCP